MKTSFLVRTIAVAALTVGSAVSLSAQKVDKAQAVDRAMAAFNATSALRTSGSDAIRPITIGARQSSSLDASDPTLDDGSHFEVWALDLRAGQTVSVTLRSRDFDTVLLLMQAENPENKAENDDFEDASTDSRISFRAPAAGTYLLLANSYEGGQRGAYSIEVASVGGAGNSGGEGMIGDMMGGGSSNNTITVGQTVQGSLTSSDPTLTDDSHYDEYTFEGNAGDKFVITMRSGGFDTYLKLADANGTEIQANDDAFDGNTDSQITVTLPARGRFTIVANSLGAGETGPYTLTLERGR